LIEYTEAPGNEVLLHVSELDWARTENVTDVVNMGDVFQVKYLGIDPKTRKEKVSRKAADAKDLQEMKMLREKTVAHALKDATIEVRDKTEKSNLLI